MTSTYPDPCETIVTDFGVYAPQHDSRLLVEALSYTGVAAGRHVADLGTGTGVVAIAAARFGAARVTAFDICPRAVRCARANARAAGVDVDVRLGSLWRAEASGPYDVVVSNPPYVPVGPLAVDAAGVARAWNGGPDGRLVLDPLCESAPRLLVPGGTLLLVQSQFSGVTRTLAALRSHRLDAELLLWQSVPFGPVMTERASWLEETGQLPVGRRDEELVVIRADKP